MKGTLISSTLGKIKATKIANEKSSGNGFNISVQILGFQDPKTMKFYDKFSPDLECYVRVHFPEKLEERANTIRIGENGVREIYTSVNYAEEAKQYINTHIPEAIEGKYRGNFTEIREYWDTDKKCLSTHAWCPLHDIMGNGYGFRVKLWNSATKIPPNEQMEIGRLLTVNGYFQQYISMPPKPKKEKKESTETATTTNGSASSSKAPFSPAAAAAAAAVAAEGVEDDDDDNEDGGDDKTSNKTTGGGGGGGGGKKDFRCPNIRLTLCTNYGMELSADNNTEASPIEIFDGSFDNKKHFCTLPTSDSDAPVLVIPLHGYQDGVNSLEEVEPGPSTIRLRQVSLEHKSYEKPPKGQPVESPLRESKLDINVLVSQYDNQYDPSTDLPYLVSCTAYQNHVWGTGITWHSQWLKYGRLDWRGYAVVQVDANDTRRNENNITPANATKNGIRGVINCWIKSILWDVEGTVRAEGIVVDKEALLFMLYADIYSDAENKKTGKRTVLFPLDQFPKRTQATRDHALHKDGRSSTVINLNEWSSDAGWIMTDSSYECVVVPYLPVPPEKKADDPNEVFGYRQSALKKLRALDADKLVEVLIGKETVKGVLTYHADELEILSNIEDPEIYAKALPGRGEVPRIYPQDIDPTKISTWNFDFLVFILKVKQNNIPTETSSIAAAASSTNTANKKNNKQKK
jgi:hypothetical protein